MTPKHKEHSRILIALLIILGSFSVTAEENRELADKKNFGAYYSGFLSSLESFSLNIFYLDEQFSGDLKIGGNNYSLIWNPESREYDFISVEGVKTFSSSFLPVNLENDFLFQLRSAGQENPLSGRAYLQGIYQILASTLAQNADSRLIFPVFLTDQEDDGGINRILYDHFYDDFYLQMDYLFQEILRGNTQTSRREIFCRIVHYQPDLVCLEILSTLDEANSILMKEVQTQVWVRGAQWFESVDIFYFLKNRQNLDDLSGEIILSLKEQNAARVVNGQLKQISSFDNFTLDMEGFTFLFNPDEVGAWEEGIYSVRIPYSQIEHLLKINTLPIE